MSFSCTVKNTGAYHTFVVGLSVWKVGQPISSAIIDTSQQVTLDPGQQPTVQLATYTFNSNQTGDWNYQFGLWKDQVGGTLLEKEPSPAGVLTVGLSPNPPIGLGQFKSDGVTPLPIGEETAGSTVVFKGVVSAPDGSQVELQLELRRTDEYDGHFDDTKGGLKESPYVNSGSEVSITVTNLIDGNYHWRARTVDKNGLYSPWQIFQNSSESTIHFIVGPWSFAIITDLHIGRSDNWPDYAAESPYDYNLLTGEANDGNEGGLNCLTDRLVDVVKWLNDNHEKENLKFVVLLGDISDSAEMSEFFRAKKTLDALQIPYVPVIGNHDIWPETQQTEGIVEPIIKGDLLFEKIFWNPSNNGNLEKLKGLFVDSWQKVKYDSSPYLQNYVFRYRNINFVCLDLAKREKTFLAQLFEDTGNWLDSRLSGESNIVFCHYPPIIEQFPIVLPSGNIIYQPIPLGGVRQDDVEKISNIIAARGCTVLWFGGHIHAFPGLNINSVFDTEFGKVIVTKALMGKETDFLRIVRVDDQNSIDYQDVRTVSSRQRDDDVDDIEFNLKNSILAELLSPGELRVYDSQNRVTGVVNGEVKEKIPNSIYDEQNEIVVIYSPSDTYRYEIVGTDEGTYGLDVAFIEGEKAAAFAAAEVPITAGVKYEYTINWDALAQGEGGITIKEDSNGDGVFEDPITTTPPYQACNPSPSANATLVSINTQLGWIGGDPDEGDDVTYKVYLGTSQNPPLVSDNQITNTYTPSTLGYDTPYYWRVVTRDNHGITTAGPIWSFTTASRPAPAEGGGGGGGGGGGSKDKRITSLRGSISEQGVMWADIQALSPDSKLQLDIPYGTIAKNRNGYGLTSVTVTTITDPNPPQAGTVITAGTYDLGPAGANFQPPITLSIKYNTSLIPEGVSEKDLFIATWDETKLAWTPVDSTVDIEKDIVITRVSHFSIYTVMARISTASFTCSDLTLPIEIDIGKSLNVSVLVTNTGRITGSYEVNLRIDNVVTQTRKVTLTGGSSERISFNVTPATPGEHTVYIGGLSGTFKVTAPQAPPPTPPVPAAAPTPASFTVSDLSVTPEKVRPSGEVTISMVVTNTGGSEGSYTIVLKINGVEEGKKDATIGAGKSETVTFTIARDIAGVFAVDVNGKTGQFTVVIPQPTTPALVEALPLQPSTNWGPIGGIIAGGVIVVVLLVYFLVWRKRGKPKQSSV